MEAGFESVFIVKLLIHTSVTCVSCVVVDIVDLNRVIFGSWIRFRIRVKSWIRIRVKSWIRIRNSRVSDPDPHGSALL